MKITNIIEKMEFGPCIGLHASMEKAIKWIKEDYWDHQSVIIHDVIVSEKEDGWIVKVYYMRVEKSG